MEIDTGTNVKLFADGADLEGIQALANNPKIRGFTTNPSLMRKAGIEDYELFARSVLIAVPNLPVSFEVFADEPDEMERQALEIASWGSNVNVKIPVTNTKGDFSGDLIKRLSSAGVHLNITAIMTVQQVRQVAACLSDDAPAFVSVFAGRIADTGRDPVPIMRNCVEELAQRPRAELIWASPRELLNILHADSIGCHIITITTDVLVKLPLIGKDLAEYSLETVKMFHADAASAKYQIKIR
ncbi:MAG: transaldolase [Rhodospirillaceae bacterium TMED8]|nr:transaldolase [Magnetovibrio sp.]OUT51273.1 MAG: transaldolase [Rhodospirillaceae bacterium TMED8]|tara:strand:- start:1009 stop:1734 length:726 start_codon:yes stop_codon:yes gene_type:complete